MIDKDIFKDLFGISLKINVEKLSTSSNPKEASLCFGLTKESFDHDRLLKIDPMLIFTTEDILFSDIIEQKHQILRFKNPRMQYIKLLRRCSFDDDIFYAKEKHDESLYFKHKSAYVSDKAVIYPFAYIGPNCHISDYVVLMPGAKLLQNTFVDSYSVIGANTVIGEWGFSIERENEKSRKIKSYKPTCTCNQNFFISKK